MSGYRLIVISKPKTQHTTIDIENNSFQYRVVVMYSIQPCRAGLPGRTDINTLYIDILKKQKQYITVRKPSAMVD